MHLQFCKEENVIDIKSGTLENRFITRRELYNKMPLSKKQINKCDVFGL